MPRAKALKRLVLAERGVSMAKNNGRTVVVSQPGGPKKTPLMLLLENRHGRDIRLLIDGPIHEIAEVFDVDPSTISKWQKKFGMSRGQVGEN